MGAETSHHFVFAAFIKFLLNFLQSEMDDVVVVHFERGDAVAKAQPEAMDEIDLIGGEVGSVGSKDFVDLVAVGVMNFEVELRFGIGQLFPGVAEMASLFFSGFLGRAAKNNGTGLERGGSAKDTIP